MYNSIIMFELPLFPLNTVLFPGMPLTLHIFEDRYKLMIGKCIQERQPFGVVLIRRGLEALGPVADTHSVGCMAFIRQVERLEQGRTLVRMGLNHRRNTIPQGRFRSFVTLQGHQPDDKQG